MSKSFSAKVVSDLLELFGMYTEKNSERMIAGALSKGEKPTPPPKNLKTRFEDNQNGRVFYANEGSTSRNTVFKIAACNDLVFSGSADHKCREDGGAHEGKEQHDRAVEGVRAVIKPLTSRGKNQV